MPLTSKTWRAGLAIAFAIAPSVAFAHTGVGSAHGFMNGFAHPLSGIDHILAMVAVGLFAANLGGRALWAVPCAFLTMTALGGFLGMGGVEIPYVEGGIALSAIALGLAVALRWNAPVTLAMAFAGLFAIFHGHAHGAEMPAGVSGAAYAGGFILGTAFLNLIGAGIGKGAGELGAAYSSRFSQIGGGVISAGGLALLIGML